MKKTICILLILLTTIIPGYAQDNYYEFYSPYPNLQIDTCSMLKINREIKGGTKIIANFDGNWDEDMKGAFRHACKIWEENLPTMLPITITAKIGTIRGNNISKVQTYRLNNDEVGIAPQARYLILQDYNHRLPVHFTNRQDSTDLCENPDITITYKEGIMNTDSISFSLDTCSITKIDFVTQAMRDIAAGLGFCTHFVPFNNLLEFPDSMAYSGLEIPVKDILSTETGNTAYNMATSGSIPLDILFYGTLNLYAPQTWQQGISLNRFYPQSNSGISQLLTWNFGKGSIIRDITDDYAGIFKYGFGWLSDLPVNAPSNVLYFSCCNNDAVSYHGNITAYPPSSLEHAYSTAETERDEIIHTNREGEDTYDYESFCRPYDPTLSINGSVDFEGWTFSILKNDGTWDVVSQSIDPNSSFSINLANTTFHFPDTAYARTTDNFLRARISRNTRESYYNHSYNNCKSTYYVLEYLPQKIEQNLAKVYDDSYLQDEYLQDIEIAMSHLEGATQIYVEQLEEGDIFPSTTVLSNLKRGRFLATVDKEYSSEFTIVSYNTHGYKRSDVLTVPALEPARLNIHVDGERIFVTYGHKNKQIEDCTYSVSSISPQGIVNSTIVSGECENGEIPTNALNEGMNVIRVSLPSGKSSSIKVRKASSSHNHPALNIII